MPRLNICFMKKEKRWIIPVIVLAVLIVCATGGFAYYMYALTQLKITDIDIDAISDFSLKGFTLSGYVDMYNPSFIAIKTKRVEYSIVFEPTSQVLSSGILDGTRLPSKEIKRVPFQKNINWAPALSLILRLAASKEPANVVFTGNVFVTEKIKLPFAYKIDLRPYIETYARDYIESQKESVVDRIQEKYGKTVGAMAGFVAKYLNV